MDTQDQDQLMTVTEVAQRLRLDATTIRRYIKSGLMDAIALPHRGKRQAYRIKSATLSALLANTTTAASA